MEKTNVMIDENSNIVDIISSELLSKYNFDIVNSTIPSVMEAMFLAIARGLKLLHTEGQTDVFVMKDTENGEHFYASLSDIEAEDEEDDKSKVLTFSFDKIEGNEVLDTSNPKFLSIIADELKKALPGGVFASNLYMIKMVNTIIDCIKTYMENNNNTTLELKGIVQISSSQENDEYVIDITPGAVVKQLIKDDDE